MASVICRVCRMARVRWQDKPVRDHHILHEVIPLAPLFFFKHLIISKFVVFYMHIQLIWDLNITSEVINNTSDILTYS